MAEKGSNMWVGGCVVGGVMDYFTLPFIERILVRLPTYKNKTGICDQKVLHCLRMMIMASKACIVFLDCWVKISFHWVIMTQKPFFFFDEVNGVENDLVDGIVVSTDYSLPPIG